VKRRYKVRFILPGIDMVRFNPNVDRSKVRKNLGIRSDQPVCARAIHWSSSVLNRGFFNRYVDESLLDAFVSKQLLEMYSYNNWNAILGKKWHGDKLIWGGLIPTIALFGYVVFMYRPSMGLLPTHTIIGTNSVLMV